MNHTVQINSWTDLQPFGIGALTGEACAYSMRLLCDVNDSGRDILAEYFGINYEGFTSPWNSQVGGQESVGSIMLTRELLMPLATFVLFRSGALALVKQGSTLIGLYDQEKVRAYHEAGYPLTRNPTEHAAQPHAGSRNVHAMTGRAV